MRPFGIACLCAPIVAALACHGPRRELRSPDAPAPIGPYSQAVAVDPFVFLAGQIGASPANGALVDGGIGPQTERALANLAAVLATEGMDLGHVVSVQAFLVDLGEFAAFNEVYARHFHAPFPARTTVGVAALPRGARVELTAIARRP